MAPKSSPLLITGLKVTPSSAPTLRDSCRQRLLPWPVLSAQNVVELRTEGGVVGLEKPTAGACEPRLLIACGRVAGWPECVWLSKIRPTVTGDGVYRCVPWATGRRFCELVGGPVRDPVEFAAYLFFRYAADHPVILSDPRLVDPWAG